MKKTLIEQPVHKKDNKNGRPDTMKDEDTRIWESFSLHIRSYRSRHVYTGHEAARPLNRPTVTHPQTVTRPLPEKPGLSPETDICRKTKKRLKSGKTEIEAVIDLHGMREAEAHAAFNRFISRSFAAGRRAVLVITGKGMSPQSEGKLKNALPVWAEMPGIKNVIQAYSFAAPEDGGTGARYILLRRNRK